MGHTGSSKVAAIGDLVICVDEARRHDPDTSPEHPKRFIGLVLDKSISVYKILVIGSGKEVYWPQNSVYSWKVKE